jgi:hypothetical protein
MGIGSMAGRRGNRALGGGVQIVEYVLDIFLCCDGKCRDIAYG